MAEQAKPKLTAKDRDALLRLAKERADVAKTAAKRRTADILAEFEVEMQSRHKHQENEVFSRVREVMGEALEAARLEIEKECDRLCIPRRFRPRIVAMWDPGGALQKEYTALRHIAKRQAEAQQAQAFEEIERTTVDVKSKIYEGGFEHDLAREIASQMPSIDSMLPPVTFRSVEQLFHRNPQKLIAEYNQSRIEGSKRHWLPPDQLLSESKSYSVDPDKGEGTTVEINKKPKYGPWAMDDDEDDY